MKIRKLTRLLAIVLLLAMGVVGCTTPSDEADASTDTAEQITIPEAETDADLASAIQLIANGETSYIIIYPAANENMEKDLLAPVVDDGVYQRDQQQKGQHPQ